MKIYTKFGDQGKTRLVGGECVDKNNPRVEAYGTVDELNSFLGLVRSQLNSLETSSQGFNLVEVEAELFRVQHELFNLGSLLACEKKETLPFLPKILESHIEALEKGIDRMTSALPELKNFILPGGSELSSTLHVCRTVCRRAERLCVGLIQAKVANTSDEVQVLESALIYLNRLSDYLFTAARFSNLALSFPDQIWDKNYKV